MAEKDALSEDICKVQRHQKQGYQYIISALEADEKENAGLADWETALKNYEKGINEFQKGIGIKLSGSGDQYERASKLQEKMKTNLKHAESRVPLLIVLIEENKAKTSSVLKDKNSSGKGVAKSTKPPFVAGASKPSSSQKPQSPIVPRSKPSSFQKPQSPVIPRSKTTTRPGVGGSKVQPAQKRGATTLPGRAGPKKPSQEEQKISKLKNIESSHAKLILDEVLDKGAGVSFDDIGGMENAKQVLQEIVILPAVRPELFTGLRAPCRGLLLFGPPGNGKTLLAKAIATESKAVFLNITAATLTSKYIGEGEKLVRAMFAVARELQPAIIFIDEIDSLLCERKENEHESVRRLKTEFLTAFDGVIAEADERILIMGATNRPWELDDAALRRLVKRILVPLPDSNTRLAILKNLLSKQSNVSMTDRDFDAVVKAADGYSGSDLTQLAKDAALMPIREYTPEQLISIPADQIRGVSKNDFETSLKAIRPSVSPKTLTQFIEWNSKYGAV